MPVSIRYVQLHIPSRDDFTILLHHSTSQPLAVVAAVRGGRGAVQLPVTSIGASHESLDAVSRRCGDVLRLGDLLSGRCATVVVVFNA